MAETNLGRVRANTDGFIPPKLNRYNGRVWINSRRPIQGSTDYLLISPNGQSGVGSYYLYLDHPQISRYTSNGTLLWTLDIEDFIGKYGAINFSFSVNTNGSGIVAGAYHYDVANNRLLVMLRSSSTYYGFAHVNLTTGMVTPLTSYAVTDPLLNSIGVFGYITGLTINNDGTISLLFPSIETTSPVRQSYYTLIVNVESGAVLNTVYTPCYGIKHPTEQYSVSLNISTAQQTATLYYIDNRDLISITKTNFVSWYSYLSGIYEWMDGVYMTLLSNVSGSQSGSYFFDKNDTVRLIEDIYTELNNA